MSKKVRGTHLADIADTGKGDEAVASLLTPGTGSIDQSLGRGANPLDVQNPPVKDAEPSNEHRTMPAPGRWKGGK